MYCQQFCQCARDIVMLSSNKHFECRIRFAVIRILHLHSLLHEMFSCEACFHTHLLTSAHPTIKHSEAFPAPQCMSSDSQGWHQQLTARLPSMLQVSCIQAWFTAGRCLGSDLP